MRVPLPAAITTTSIAVMVTVPLDASIIRHPAVPGLLHWLRRGALTLLLLTQIGCSWLETGYNQSPFLLQWWLDRQFELDSQQKHQVKGELRQLLAWHRQTQLPVIARSVQGLAEQATQDLSAAQTCAFQDAVLQSLPVLAQEASRHLTRLALSLRPEQLAHMRRHLDKEDEKWREEWLDGSAEDRLKRRYKKALENLEDHYGRLDADQKKALRQLLMHSPYDPDLAWKERQRRQADLLDTLERIRAQQPEAAVAQSWLFDTYSRMLQPPVEAHRNHQLQNARFICEGLSQMHALMRPDQRQQAQQKLGQRHQALTRLLNTG
jgi:hypothetical protein